MSIYTYAHVLCTVCQVTEWSAFPYIDIDVSILNVYVYTFTVHLLDKCTAVIGNIHGDDSSLDQESLLLTVEALKAQLEEQTKLCKEQVSTCI